ncbi:MAG: hypothetical protein N2510_07855 [Ignavibacteria bacterium]|nr:hypothetical protein [Ignavibacteria bacterium]
MNKYLSDTFLFLILITLFCSCSSSKKTDNYLKKSKYFIIYADSDDDYIFSRLQDDLNIYPKMERYRLTVDIRNPDPAMNYIIIGETERFPWTKLSEEVRKGLVNWTGSNKERLD